MEQQRQEQWEEQCRREQQEEEDREALRIQEEELRLEMQRMAKKGYQEKVNDRKLMIPDVNIPKFKMIFNIKICLKPSLSDPQQTSISLDMSNLQD